VIPANNIEPPELARLAVESMIRHALRLDSPSQPSGILARRTGVFVTLRTDDGNLRGCIGTIEPFRVHVAAEIIYNAICAATRDPRFPPVELGELAGLHYGVDILNPPELVKGPDELDPAIYGVIVESADSSKRGLLLPHIRGLETVERQWMAVHQKAGLSLGEPVRVWRFTVSRFGKD